MGPRHHQTTALSLSAIFSILQCAPMSSKAKEQIDPDHNLMRTPACQGFPDAY
jgi:hypothetical protein